MLENIKERDQMTVISFAINETVYFDVFIFQYFERSFDFPCCSAGLRAVSVVSTWAVIVMWWGTCAFFVLGYLGVLLATDDSLGLDNVKMVHRTSKMHGKTAKLKTLTQSAISRRLVFVHCGTMNRQTRTATS